jgi:hypothetical protein
MVTLPVVGPQSEGSTIHTDGAAGVVPGAGVIELLVELGHPLIVLVAVIAVVLLTLIGFVLAPLLQVNSAAGILSPLPSFAVMVVVPSQLSVFDKTGSDGVVFGAGAIEVLVAL